MQGELPDFGVWKSFFGNFSYDENLGAGVMSLWPYVRGASLSFVRLSTRGHASRKG
jgi:hypothetical protein